MGVTPLDRGWQHGALVKPQPGSLSMANLSMVVGLGSSSLISVELSQINATELSIRLSLPPQIPFAQVCLPPCFGTSPATATKMTVDRVSCSSKTEGRFLCCKVKCRASGEALVITRSVDSRVE